MSYIFSPSYCLWTYVTANDLQFGSCYPDYLIWKFRDNGKDIQNPTSVTVHNNFCRILNKATSLESNYRKDFFFIRESKHANYPFMLQEKKCYIHESSSRSLSKAAIQLEGLRTGLRTSSLGVLDSNLHGLKSPDKNIPGTFYKFHAISQSFCQFFRFITIVISRFLSKNFVPSHI